MPVETASFISQLNPAYPTANDPTEQGYQHLQLIKTVLQDQFTNLGTVAVTATAADLNAAGTAFNISGAVVVAPGSGSPSGSEIVLQAPTGGGDASIYNPSSATTGGSISFGSKAAGDGAYTTTMYLDGQGNLNPLASVNAPSIKKAGSELVPTGIITLWYGSVANIPPGWALCDGTKGTPNLVDYVVVGASSAPYAGQVGGFVGTQSAALPGNGGLYGVIKAMCYIMKL